MTKHPFSTSNYTHASLQEKDLIALEKQAVANNDFPMLVSTYMHRFKLYFHEKRYSDSLIVLNDCEKMFEEIENDDLLVEFLRCKTMTIALNFQLQQNIEKLPAIIKQAKAVENNELLSLAYFLLSRCYASLGKFHEAIKFVITSWYYIKKVNNAHHEQEGIIINYYCLYLLQVGEFNKVQQLMDQYGDLISLHSRSVILGTLQLRTKRVDEAANYYESFLQAIISNEVYIFLDFQLMHIENEVSSYLNTEKHVKLIDVYKQTVEIRMQLLSHQFKAGQQNISSFRNDTMPIDFFIIEGQNFLDEQLTSHYVCNMFIKLSHIGDFIESKIMLEKVHRQIRSILQRENLQFYDGKMDYNSLNSLFVTAKITKAEKIVAEIGRLIENEKLNNTGEIVFVKTILKHKEKIDFYEIYSNTVSKIFI